MPDHKTERLAALRKNLIRLVGVPLLASSGEITYLAIFASLMVFLAVRPQGLMGKPWG